MVVPARDESATLDPLLRALLGQTRRADEIVVADAGSSDATSAVAARYAADGVRVVTVGPAYPGGARNSGITAASHDWIALIDAGCLPERTWLESLVAAADASGTEVVFGQYGPAVRSEWDTAQALAVVAPPDPRTGYRGPSTASMLIHRSAWEAAGRFPEHLRAAEDLVFFDRLAAAAVTTSCCPSARVQWTLAPGPRAVFRRLRLYSWHHLAAGLFRTWHLRVTAMDVVGLLLLAGAAWWPAGLALFALGGFGRVIATVNTRRTASPAPFRPDRLLRVAVLLVLADAAMWAGVADHLMARRR